MGIGQPDEPAPSIPGMAGVKLDVAGRLLEFYRIPLPELEPATAALPNCGPLLEAAQVQNLKVTSTASRWTPPMFADAQAAWDVTDADGIVYHAEAAALRGRPVWFRLTHDQERIASEQQRIGGIAWWAMIYLAIVGTVALLAIRNLVRRRCDIRGALQTLGVMWAGWLVYWLATAHLPASGAACYDTIMGVIGYIGFTGLFVGVCYLALEPVARRRWPWYLTAWSRFLAGRWRDPLVGRDVLVGLVLGGAVIVMSWTSPALAHAMTGDRSSLSTTTAVFAEGPISLLGDVASGSIDSGLFGFAIFLLALLIVRKTWLAWLAVVAFFTLVWASFSAPSAEHPVALACWLGITLIRNGLLVLVAARYGLLAIFAGGLSMYAILISPLTPDTGAWYFWYAAGPMLAIVILAAAALYTATGGRRLFKEGFFGDD